MLERRQPVLYAWEGEIPLREVPTDVLYEVRFEMTHDASAAAAHTLTGALEDFGRVDVSRWPFLGTRIRVRGERHRLDLRVRADRVHVRLRNRVKGRALGHIVEALAALPGARDLTIRAESPTFDPAYSDVRPCTTCAASRLPPSRRRA